jgi:hypothetical protein
MELGDLARRLLDGDHLADTQAEARALVRQGLEEELLSEMLSVLASRGALGDRAIPLAMARLEALAEVDFMIAGALMARLCPRAAKAFMHDVADAIDLWFGASRNSELAELFQQAAERERDPRMGSFYRNWAENLVATDEPK